MWQNLNATLEGTIKNHSCPEKRQKSGKKMLGPRREKKNNKKSNRPRHTCEKKGDKFSDCQKGTQDIKICTKIDLRGKSLQNLKVAVGVENSYKSNRSKPGIK